jgi:hypothetical protein
VVTVTLIIDYWQTPEFAKCGSGLTRKQRALVIVVMILLTDLGFGALIYCFMMDIKFLDALYFSVCSILTIGFGDISPSTSGARVFSIFYNTFGILNTGLAIAIARETIIESFKQSYRDLGDILAENRVYRKSTENLEGRTSQVLGQQRVQWSVPDRQFSHVSTGVSMWATSVISPTVKETRNVTHMIREEAEEFKAKVGRSIFVATGVDIDLFTAALGLLGLVRRILGPRRIDLQADREMVVWNCNLFL